MPKDNGTPPTFQNNAGKTAQFIKLREHPYLKGKGYPSCPECRRQGLAKQTNLQDEDAQLCPMHRLAKLYSKEERKRMPKEAEKEVITWAKDNVPIEGWSMKKENIKSKKVLVYRRSIKDLLGHTSNPTIKKLVIDINNILDKATFKEEAKLNIDSHNYETKVRRGVIGYRYYDVEVEGLTLQIDMEVRSLAGREVEVPYAIREK